MPPIYFIHGMWSTPATFTGLRVRLEASGWSTAAATLPYHDRSPELPPAPELSGLGVDDYIRHLVADIRGMPETPIIAGHSLGGFLAQAVAAEVQPPGLVLLSTGPSAGASHYGVDPVRTVWNVVRKWGWWKRATLLDAESARWGIYNGVPGEIADAEIRSLVWDSGRVLQQLSFPFAAGTDAVNIDYRKLAMPALVVVGSADRITPAALSRATARRLTGPIDYHEITGAPHWLFHPPVVTAVGDILEDWLATTFGAPPAKLAAAAP